MYPCEFKADEGKKSGIATYMVDGERFILALDSFADCRAIGKMLVLAEKQGSRDAKISMIYALKTMVNKIRVKK